MRQALDSPLRSCCGWLVRARGISGDSVSRLRLSGVAGFRGIDDKEVALGFLGGFYPSLHFRVSNDTNIGVAGLDRRNIRFRSGSSQWLFRMGNRYRALLGYCIFLRTGWPRMA